MDRWIDEDRYNGFSTENSTNIQKEIEFTDRQTDRKGAMKSKDRQRNGFE
jgi:hypothetical protein